MPFILFSLVLAFGVMLIFGGTEFDRGILMLFHATTRPDIAQIARWVTELGGAWVLIPVMIAGTLLLLVQRRWRDALLLVLITMGGRMLVEGLKIWTARARPDEHEHLVAVQSLAFPSAHSANSTITWLTLAFLLTRHTPGRTLAVWLAVWTAILVGVSRMILGVHWPTDVIGGWAFGLFWTFLLLRLSGVAINDGTPRLPPTLKTEGGPT